MVLGVFTGRKSFRFTRCSRGDQMSAQLRPASQGGETGRRRLPFPAALSAGAPDCAQDLLKTAARTFSLLQKQVEILVRISRRPLVLVAKLVSDGLHWHPSGNAVVFTHGERAPG